MVPSHVLPLLEVMPTVREAVAHAQAIRATSGHLLGHGQVRRCDDAGEAAGVPPAVADAAASRLGWARALPRDVEASPWGELAEALLIMGIMTFLLLV